VTPAAFYTQGRFPDEGCCGMHTPNICQLETLRSSAYAAVSWRAALHVYQHHHLVVVY